MNEIRTGRNGLWPWGRGGDYEGISNKSEVGRPLLFYGLQAAISFIKICVFTLYEAFLIGAWHWAVMLIASAISLISNPQLDPDTGKLHVEVKIGEFFVFTFFSGVFSATMSLLGATVWPGYSIEGGRMYVESGGSIQGMHAFFIWLRFILIVFPLTLTKPTRILEWVALIESIMPRFRSTNFQTIDPKHVETPIGRLETKDVPAPVIPPYPMMPVEEADDEEEVEYVISDSTSEITEVNV